MLKVSEKTKKILYATLWDTVDVALWSGAPATGVVAFLELIGKDFPAIVAYSPYIATLINIIGFFVVRFRDYQKGKRKLPVYIAKS